MKKYIFLVLICVCSILQAKIVDVFHVNELPNYLKVDDCLVIFDIDNTLMEPMQALGSDQWFDKRIKKFCDEGCSPRQALCKTYDEWHKIQTVSDVKLVENDTKQVFDSVKEKYNVIALTTRGFQVSYNTITQLESLGIVFDTKSYLPKEAFFENVNEDVLFPESYS